MVVIVVAPATTIANAIAAAAAAASGCDGGHQIHSYFVFSNITHYYVNIFVKSIV